MPEIQGSFSYTYPTITKRLTIPVELYAGVYGEGESLVIEALWDTGATISAVNPDIAKKLKLVPVDNRIIGGVHSSTRADIALASIVLPNQTTLPEIRIAVCNLPSNLSMIIGMNIITQGDTTISNGNNQTIFSFIVPPRGIN
jgi:hypothetical protein